MTTCAPVKIDEGEWQSAVFFELGGEECKLDRRILNDSTNVLPIALEADTIELATASVVMLRFEILTDRKNPLAGEVLVAPGLGDVQFETLENLTHQQNLGFFFADSEYNVIYSQQLRLHDRERLGYKEILDAAVAYDAVIRMTGRYDAVTALKEVVDQYAKRVS